MLSPLFWTLLVLFVALIILIIMSILYWLPKGRTHYRLFVRILKHTDLIGEGELWFGGLVSFGLLVLIIFSLWFGLIFLKQYPIETASPSNFACDATIRNAKFNTALQLLTLIKSEEEKLIFDLLDRQIWTMKIDFIQTGFQCNEISVQVGHTNYGSISVISSENVVLFREISKRLT